MKNSSLTIVFDDKALKPGLVPGWGFACVIRFARKTILFDTGADGAILLDNMKKLNIDPGDIEVIVLSHAHWDHANGLGHILARSSDVTVYLPRSFSQSYKESVVHSGARLEEITEAKEISDGVFTTGEMAGIIPEEALAFKTAQGTVVITGCAHPGIVEIVQLAKELTGERICLALGGFHFPERSIVDSFGALGVQKVAPCHCSGNQALDFFHEAYGDDCVEIGVGKEIEIE